MLGRPERIVVGLVGDGAGMCLLGATMVARLWIVSWLSLAWNRVLETRRLWVWMQSVRCGHIYILNRDACCSGQRQCNVDFDASGQHALYRYLIHQSFVLRPTSRSREGIPIDSLSAIALPCSMKV